MKTCKVKGCTYPAICPGGLCYNHWVLAGRGLKESEMKYLVDVQLLNKNVYGMAGNPQFIKEMRIQFSGNRHHAVEIHEPFNNEAVAGALMQLAMRIARDPALRGNEGEQK